MILDQIKNPPGMDGGMVRENPMQTSLHKAAGLSILSRVLTSVAILSVIVSLIPASPVRAAGAVYYVTSTATYSHTCANWANACSMGSALDKLSTGDEIWAAEGSYNSAS
jgi:hypothetical protein